MRLPHCCVPSKKMNVNKQHIKLVALDLDGTLLDSRRNIQAQTVEAIQAIRERGIKVTLATGRPLVSALPFAKLLNLDVPLITCNGACISLYPEGRFVERTPISMGAAREMIGELEDAGYYVKVYVDDTLYVEETTRATMEFSKAFGIAFIAVGRQQLRNLTADPLKIVVIERSERIKDVWQLLARWQEQFTINRDGIHGIEITQKAVNKGAALEKVCRLLDIPLSQVMAVGNEGNDLEMIRYAGIGVAMENAYEKLKQQAQLVTKTNDEQGVAYVLHKYILDKKE
jgi:Cof subfamily protein (haloacid dehalogenase superfamily)